MEDKQVCQYKLLDSAYVVCATDRGLIPFRLGIVSLDESQGPSL